MFWYNKEALYVIEREADWDNPKDNFTKVVPPAQCVTGHVGCAWNELAQSWDIDSVSDQAYTDKQTAIQNFVNSPFNNITIEQAGAYIDNNSTSLAAANEVMKKMVEFTIGLREVLRERIKIG